MPIIKEGLKIIRNCFGCGKSISSALTGTMRQEITDPPAGATCWTTQGNFGSVIFDPIANGCDEKLEICICDECLKEKRGLVFKYVEQRQVVALSKW